MATDPADLKLFVQAIERAAAAIPAKGHFVESDLRDAIVAQMADLGKASPDHVVPAATEVKMGQLPGWDPSDPPGKFDMAIGAHDRERLSTEATLLAVSAPVEDSPPSAG